MAPGLARQVVRDAEEAVEEAGWRTDRHRHYATTDIEVRTVPKLFLPLQPLLAQAEVRAAELFNEAHGLSFRDVFVVKYSNEMQRGLGVHQDGSVVTLQVTLSEDGTDFGGGGTYFPELACRAQPGIGEAMVFPGGFRHGAVNVSWGTRHVLVAFSERSGANPDSQTLHLTFGSSYKVAIDAGLPCFRKRPGGPTLHAVVDWVGCSSTGFQLHHDRSPRNAHMHMYWLERVDSSDPHCEAAARERSLEVAFEGDELSDADALVYFAFPPGHRYETSLLDDCEKTELFERSPRPSLASHVQNVTAHPLQGLFEVGMREGL